jgi:hypothetical protein
VAGDQPVEQRRCGQPRCCKRAATNGGLRMGCITS